MSSVAAARTTPPGGKELILLFDGHCRFCTRSAKRLARGVGPAVKPVSFQEEGVLAAFPGVSYEACMKRMHVIEPNGRVFAGAAAVARAVRAVRYIGWLGALYYVPIVKQFADFGYWLVAKYRYRLFGRQACEPGGTCHLHG